MNMDIAFKCKITPDQEHLLGEAMMAHEKGIDRGYMSHNSDLRWTAGGLKAFPRKRRGSQGIMQDISDMTEDEEFLLAPLLEKHRHSTVHLVVKKMVECGALTRTSGPPGGRFKAGRYMVTVDNKMILEEILNRG